MLSLMIGDVYTPGVTFGPSESLIEIFEVVVGSSGFIEAASALCSSG